MQPLLMDRVFRCFDCNPDRCLAIPNVRVMTDTLRRQIRQGLA
jgi:hypothetical protein